MQQRKKSNVLIVGGGFGGVKAAQILGKDSRLSVKLVDPKSYMEYHAAIYRLTTGRSPLEICIPYTDLLRNSNVEIAKDIIASIDPVVKTATGSSGSVYSYDIVIVAVGCTSSYFGIKGVEENAFTINSVDEALKLRRHLHKSFEKAKSSIATEKVPLLHVVIIGGGASGTEIAGEFGTYARARAKKHNIDPSLVTIDLIEAMPRILPALPSALSARALERLRELGVNVYLNRSVVREDTDELFLKDMQMTTKTVVWTAGLKANTLTNNIAGAVLDKRRRILTNDHLQALGIENMYIIGDVASTKYSGMAQTALADAAFVASDIKANLSGEVSAPYRQPAPSYAVPVGPNYAVVLYHGLQFYGLIGWILRRAADLRAFLSLLSPAKSILAWISGTLTQESCPICDGKHCYC